jgi:hypothetical protein
LPPSGARPPLHRRAKRGSYGSTSP